MEQLNILNVSIDNLSCKELLKRLGNGGGVVYTPNVYHVIRLQQDPEFYQVYQEADYRVCDSQILFYVSRFLGCPIREKISGSDLFPAFYHYYRHDHSVTIFLLGAGEGVGDRARWNVNCQVQREMVIDTYSPPFGFETDEAECRRIIDRIRQSGATVVAVGLGAPKQEKWIQKYRAELPQVKTFLAIGATIDFEAGQVRRSPKWVSQAGLEWLYRILMEPRRLWKRYWMDAVPFVGLVISQRLGLYRDPFVQRGFLKETVYSAQRSVS